MSDKTLTRSIKQETHFKQGVEGGLDAARDVKLTINEPLDGSVIRQGIWSNHAHERISMKQLTELIHINK